MVTSNTNRSRRGIMRTEVVVVVCLLILLACLVIPLVSRARNQSDRIISTDRLREMGQQFHIYHDRYRSFPVMPGPVPAENPETPEQTTEEKYP